MDDNCLFIRLKIIYLQICIIMRRKIQSKNVKIVIDTLCKKHYNEIQAIIRIRERLDFLWKLCAWQSEYWR